MPSREKPAGGPPPFFRRRDVLVVAALLLAAGVWLAVSLLGGPAAAGGTATVTWVRTAQHEPLTVDLAGDQIVHIEDADLPVTLQVKDGAIRFIDSVCPDHLCEQAGWLRGEGEWAACLPAGVMVTVAE